MVSGLGHTRGNTEIFSNLWAELSLANTPPLTSGPSVESKSWSGGNSQLTYQCPDLGEEEDQHNQANLHPPVFSNVTPIAEMPEFLGW